MKKIRTKTLLEIINNVMLVVDKKSSLPILEEFCFRDGKLIVTDLTMMIAKPIPELNGLPNFLVNATWMQKIVKQLAKTDFIEIDYDEVSQKIFISSGSRKFSAVCNTPCEQYPLIFEIESIKVHQAPILPEHFDSMVKMIPFMSNDDIRPIMCGIALRKGEALKGNICATDAHVLRWDDIDLPKDLFLEIPNAEKRKVSQAILPKKFMVIASKLKGINEMFWADKAEDRAVGFMMDDYLFITKIEDGVYPNIEAVIPDDLTGHVRVGLVELEESLKDALLCANTTTKQVRLKYDKDKLEVKSEDLDFGNEYVGHVDKCIDKRNELCTEMGFNITLLQRVLKNSKCSVPGHVDIKYSKANRAAIINGNCLAMPVMINY